MLCVLGYAVKQWTLELHGKVNCLTPLSGVVWMLYICIHCFVYALIVVNGLCCHTTTLNLGLINNNRWIAPFLRRRLGYFQCSRLKQPQDVVKRQILVLLIAYYAKTPFYHFH